MKPPRVVWIVLPILVFATLLIFFVSRLPRPRSATVAASPSPISNLQSPISAPAASSELQQIADEIRSFRLDDPAEQPPSFSRSLDIPAE